MFRCGYFSVFTCFLHVDRKGVEESAHGPETSTTAVADSNPKRNMNVSQNTPAKIQYRRSTPLISKQFTGHNSGTVSLVSDPYKLHPYSISLNIPCPHTFIRLLRGPRTFSQRLPVKMMHVATLTINHSLLVFTIPEILCDLFPCYVIY